MGTPTLRKNMYQIQHLENDTEYHTLWKEKLPKIQTQECCLESYNLSI